MTYLFFGRLNDRFEWESLAKKGFEQKSNGRCREVSTFFPLFRKSRHGIPSRSEAAEDENDQGPVDAPGNGAADVLADAFNYLGHQLLSAVDERLGIREKSRQHRCGRQGSFVFPDELHATVAVLSDYVEKFVASADPCQLAGLGHHRKTTTVLSRYAFEC